MKIRRAPLKSGMLLATHSFPFVSVRRPPACDRLAADSPTLFPGDKVPKFVWRPHSRAVARIAPDSLLSEVFSAGFTVEKALSFRRCPTGSSTRCIQAVGLTTLLLEVGCRPLHAGAFRHVGLKRRVSPLISQTDFKGVGMQSRIPAGSGQASCSSSSSDTTSARAGFPLRAPPTLVYPPVHRYLPLIRRNTGSGSFPLLATGAVRAVLSPCRLPDACEPETDFHGNSPCLFLPSRLPCAQHGRCRPWPFPVLRHSTRLPVYPRVQPLVDRCRLAAAFPRSCSLCGHDTTEGNG